MSRVVALSLSAAALLALAGCGDTCSTKPADVAAVPTSCTLPASTSAQIEVQLCSKCTDSGPACQAEFVNSEFEVAPTFQECQANNGCPIASGCGIDNSRVTCTVTTPSNPGTYNLVTSAGQVGTVTVVSGGSASCSL